MFDKQTKVVAKKGEWDKIAGPAMAAAEVMVEAAELSETWEDRSDAEKVAGVCGVLGSACLTVAPFLPPPANAIVAAVGAALKIMEFIIPKLFSGGGDGGSGGNKSSKADGKNAGPGKPGNPKKPDPKGNGAGHSVTAAAVAGAYADGKGDPQKTAQGVGQRLGLNAEQTKRLEGAYAKAMKETPSSSTPQQKLDALTDATTKEVPESKAQAEEKGRQVKSQADAIKKELEKKPGAKPDDLRRDAANLAAKGKPDVAEKVLITLQSVPTDNLAYLTEYAAMMAWSFDPTTISGIGPKPEN